MAAALAGVSLAAIQAQAHDVLRGRLVFTDHAEPVVSVLDLDSGKVSHRFEVTKANPTLITTKDGRFVVIRTSDDEGTVRLLDTGQRFEAHGDHHDLEKSEPGLRDLVLTGSKPAHVVSDNGWLTVFYDGDRPWNGPSDHKIVFIDEAALAAGEVEPLARATPHPQHGIAVPLGNDLFLVSVSNEAYARGDDQNASARPDGFEIVDRAADWAVVADLNDTGDADRSCNLFHGHAGLGGIHVFGCEADLGEAPGSHGGVLVVAEGDGGWTSRKLAYPDGRRSSTIKSGGGRYLVGNYGGGSGSLPYAALLRIDPTVEALSAEDILELPEGQEVCQFEVLGNGKGVVNLTADGKLRVYELDPVWREAATFDAVAAFDCAWNAPSPQPGLALVGNSAFVSDPENGRIREFYLNTLKEGLDFAVDGLPARLANGNHPG